MGTMSKEEILKILEDAKDKNSDVPMRLVRQAFEKLPEPCEDAVSRRRLLNDLKELIAAWKKYPVMAEQIKGVETTIGYVKLIPPVTPKRKPGKWMNLQLIPDDITGHTYGECSICGKLRIVDNYCPNCGSFNGGYDVNE